MVIVEHFPSVYKRDVASYEVKQATVETTHDGCLGDIVTAKFHTRRNPLNRQLGTWQCEVDQVYLVARVRGIFQYPR